MTSSLLVRAGVVCGVAILGWALLSAYGGVLFLLCLAVAGWRLWRIDAEAITAVACLSRVPAGATRRLYPCCPRSAPRGRWIVPWRSWTI